MIVAIIANTKIMNVAIFEELSAAQTFLNAGVWDDIGADLVIELKDGYGIGDYCANGVWTKDETIPEPPEPENHQFTEQERTEWLETFMYESGYRADAP